MSAPTRPSLFVEWRTPIALFVVTCLSTFFVGANMELQEGAIQLDGVDGFFEYYGVLVGYYASHPAAYLAGWTFAVPLMAILLSHELGHYIAGRIHGVDISPPFFIPMPFFLLGTMGAVIRMRDRIETKNALLDVGAAGPLAGMLVALPVLAWGIAISDVKPLDGMPDGSFIEGRSILYLAMIHSLKDIPAGHDIFLSSTAFAGWAGLLVTQINLVPVAQLDGGHVAYALFGERQNTYSRRVHRALPFIGAGVSLFYVILSYIDGERGPELYGEAFTGFNWVVWAIVLAVLIRFSGADHPPTGPDPLSRGRKMVAAGTLVLFVLIFMPFWIYMPNM
jgi:membrane-associated protease RseP (regulator of RpoE activity)